MRDDNTEPRDNQQIADDSQQSDIDMTRGLPRTSRTGLRKRTDSAQGAARGDRTGDEPAD